jgi:hypothetical protein
MFYQGHFRGKDVFMHRRGRTRMLLVLLLDDKRLETSGIAVFNRCFRDQNGRQRRISTKETNNKKAHKIAEEFERAARTKWTLKQVQVVLDRLYEEVSDERVIRAIFHSYFLLPTFVLTEAILRGVKVWQTRSL